jgi:hypothetical protein
MPARDTLVAWVLHLAAAALGIVIAVLLASPQRGVGKGLLSVRTGETPQQCPRNATVSSTAASSNNPLGWSCWGDLSRCGVVYHAFALSPERLDRLTESRTLGEEFWIAFDAATHLHHAMRSWQSSASTPSFFSTENDVEGEVLDIYLVTNYPPEFVEQLRRSIGIHRWPFHVVAVPFYSEPLKKTFVSKPDGLVVPLRRPSDGRMVERVLYLDTDTAFGTGFNTSPSMSGSRRDFYASMARRAGHGADSGSWCRSEDDGREAHLTGTKTPRTLILQLMCDVLDTLQHRGLAMVPEFNCFRDGGPWLYTDILDGASHVPRHHPQLLEVTVSPANVTIRKKRSSKTSPFRLFSPYELQFNTGVIAYRASDPAVMDLLRLWSRLHRQIPRCVSDTVAWDQCSLPQALRRRAGKMESPLILPPVFNTREALGRGCSPLLYSFQPNSGPVLIEENIVISHMASNKRAAVQRLTSTRIGGFMTCFGKGTETVDCSKKHLTG